MNESNRQVSSATQLGILHLFCVARLQIGSTNSSSLDMSFGELGVDYQGSLCSNSGKKRFLRITPKIHYTFFMFTRLETKTHLLFNYPLR